MANAPRASDLTERIQHLHMDRSDVAETLSDLDAKVTAQERADAEKQERLAEQWYARIAALFDVDTEHLLAVAEHASRDAKDRHNWAHVRQYLEAVAAETIACDRDTWSAPFRQVHAQTFCRVLEDRVAAEEFDGDRVEAVHQAWRTACWTALWYEDQVC